MAGRVAPASNLCAAWEMKGPLGTFAAIAVALLAIAPPAAGEEQTRESYKAQVEPICQANREANERIMDGARERINKGKLEPAGKQFIRASGSFGELIKQLAPVPPPPADDHRIERWLEQMRLLKQRLRNVGKYYKAGEKIKATHESILTERSGLSANNTSIVFHFHYCRFGHIG
jgi:hypothetical protein